jgi:hypothetical protein
MQAAAIVHPFRCLTHPTDAAIARIDEDIMAMGTKRAIPPTRISPTFSPAQGEIVFIHGYPGKDSRFSAIGQGIHARTCPFATDVPVLPAGYDPQLYFALSYPGSTEVKNFHGKRTTLPDPHGLSGTLVWDMRFAATGKAGWLPIQAIIAGLIWGWNEKNQCLIATKVEVVRHFLILALRYEAAYFRWLERKKLANDDWSDWLWAERHITDIV